MKTHLTPVAAAAVVALFTLSACNNEPETNVADANAQAEPAAPPPQLKMIQASRTYRSKDNSVLRVDFYTNDTAAASLGEDGERVELTAAGGQPPYTAEGWSISANEPEITVTLPGKGTLTCRDA